MDSFKKVVYGCGTICADVGVAIIGMSLFCLVLVALSGGFDLSGWGEIVLASMAILLYIVARAMDFITYMTDLEMEKSRKAANDFRAKDFESVYQDNLSELAGYMLTVSDEDREKYPLIQNLAILYTMVKSLETKYGLLKAAVKKNGVDTAAVEEVYAEAKKLFSEILIEVVCEFSVFDFDTYILHVDGVYGIYGDGSIEYKQNMTKYAQKITAAQNSVEKVLVTLDVWLRTVYENSKVEATAESVASGIPGLLDVN